MRNERSYDNSTGAKDFNDELEELWYNKLPDTEINDFMNKKAISLLLAAVFKLVSRFSMSMLFILSGSI